MLGSFRGDGVDAGQSSGESLTLIVAVIIAFVVGDCC